jgi:wyosine [tRNA(Phe)-imidazoG37] synthetase (radical SAM superfamily)
MGHTYGPVASWRYGRSLGIDVTTYPKKCTFNCIYCQIGPTKNHVVTPYDIQDSLPSSQDILEDVFGVLKRLDLNSIDAVTFSGAGEPTLNLEVGVLADAIQREIQNLPIILLTNASLLPDPNVRSNLKRIDIISAKVDAGDEETFKRINHPAKGSSSLVEITEGIKKLHNQMFGTLALEVMLLRGPKGLTNVEGKARRALIEKIVEIDPDIVQVYTPWRPSSIAGVQSLSGTVLTEFGHELSEHLSMEKIWVYGVHDARSRPVKWNRHDRIETEVMDLLKRRPCRVKDVTVSMGVKASVVKRILDDLLKNGEVAEERVAKEIFYKLERPLEN